MSLFTELMNATGEIFEASFTSLVKLGNVPNVLIIVTTFCLLIVWVNIMLKYKKEARENGTIE
ncbi:MAG: hypothetical protein IH948_01690 [Bacteroidetes bacterium]|nr:hypothetical protein [Bacteroidota bacterium]